MRVGTNHGSLSDRILSRYGDTPLGMVESALEFVRICEELNYYNIVLSMKASNTQVMVQAYRLLVQKLNEEGLKPYPLHLGVTEAGEGEDGRIKSAVGIGTLLEDGLGDTVRVSLTEDPEFEAPVAKMLVDRYNIRAGHNSIKPIAHDESPVNPYMYQRRDTREVMNIGGGNVPRVIIDFSKVSDKKMDDLKSIGHFYMPLLDKWNMNDQGADFIYTGNNRVPFMLPNGLKEILNHSVWLRMDDRTNIFPLITLKDYFSAKPKHKTLNFIQLTIEDLDDEVMDKLRDDLTAVLIIDTFNLHALPEQRRAIFELMINEVPVPVILMRKYPSMEDEQLQLYAATDCGGLLIDGLGDGVLLSTELVNVKSKDLHLKLLKPLIQPLSESFRQREPGCRRRNTFLALPAEERFLTFRKQQL